MAGASPMVPSLLLLLLPCGRPLSKRPPDGTRQDGKQRQHHPSPRPLFPKRRLSRAVAPVPSTSPVAVAVAATAAVADAPAAIPPVAACCGGSGNAAPCLLPRLPVLLLMQAQPSKRGSAQGLELPAALRGRSEAQCSRAPVHHLNTGAWVCRRPCCCKPRADSRCGFPYISSVVASEVGCERGGQSYGAKHSEVRLGAQVTAAISTNGVMMR